MKTVGWIGTGQMGVPMVKNLLQAGFTVMVNNRTPEKAQPLVEAGARRLQSPAAVVQQSDLVFLMLSNGSAIREVMTAQEGILSAMQPGKTIIDMSTIAPEDSQTFALLVSEKGGRYIDAPVSGSVGAAETAQLVILAGAKESELAPYKPFFDVLGKKTIAFGGVSKGSSAKLAINLLLGITGQGIAETLLLAERAGLEQEHVLELIGQSSMNTGLFQAKKEMYRRQSFPAAFMLNLMTKDLGLITDEANRLGLELPLARETHATFTEAKEHGRGKLDMAAVYLELKERNAQK
jgi:3-hydroxyisobutyrate dehydrogenase